MFGKEKLKPRQQRNKEKWQQEQVDDCYVMLLGGKMKIQQHELHYHDVISQRGQFSNIHPGNINFRKLALSKKQSYVCAKENDKREVAASIVREIQNLDPPGRFLKRMSDRKGRKKIHWFELLTAEQATNKAMACLRDVKLMPDYSSSLVSKECPNQITKITTVAVNSLDADVSMGYCTDDLSKIGDMSCASSISLGTFGSIRGHSTCSSKTQSNSIISRLSKLKGSTNKRKVTNSMLVEHSNVEDASNISSIFSMEQSYSKADSSLHSSDPMICKSFDGQQVDQPNQPLAKAKSLANANLLYLAGW